MTQSKWWLAGLAGVLVMSSSGSSYAAIFSGHQLQIGWTGSAAFGSFYNSGSGTADGLYTAPMGGTSFSTSSYASSTAMQTSVQDTTITITNQGAGFVPPQWLEYLDVNDSLPDFTTMTFTVDAAHTTDTNFNLASDLEIEPHALAIEFAEVPSGDTVTIDVAVPEPSTMGLIGLGVAMLWRGGRKREAIR